MVHGIEGPLAGHAQGSTRDVVDRGTSHVRRRLRKAQPVIDRLEGRQMMSADFESIRIVSLPDDVGQSVVLKGLDSDPRSFEVSSVSDSIETIVAEGPTLKFDISHEAASETDVTFSGTVETQLWENLTPLAVDRIGGLTEDGFYDGLELFRVANNFPGEDDFIIQGGSATNDASGSVNDLPGFPFVDEFNDFIAFNQPGRLAMANSGPDSNGSQFFFAEGEPRFLDPLHTIFGQVTRGLDILDLMTQVELQDNGSGSVEEPVNPIVITDAELVENTQDGLIVFDTTEAGPGDSATVTVTSTNTITGETSTQTFLAAIPTDTGAARFESGVLLVTPPPQAGRSARNTIEVLNDDENIFVLVNGELDTVQPLLSETFRVVVYGTKASDTIIISPDLPVTTTLNGGQGGRNQIVAGGAPSRIRAFFGRNLVQGSEFDDFILGRPFTFRIIPSPGTDDIFVARPNPINPVEAPDGDFFRARGERIVPFEVQGPRREGMATRALPWTF